MSQVWTHPGSISAYKKKGHYYIDRYGKERYPPNFFTPRYVAPSDPYRRKRSMLSGYADVPFLGKVGFNYASGAGRKNASASSAARSTASSIRSIGSGRSVMTAPVSVGTSTVRTQPVVKASPTGQLCFKNKEVISQLAVPGDATFTTYSYVINPGLPIFPLLRNLARCFQRYNMKIKFFFETSVPSTTQGQSLIIVNRNVQEEVPTTYSEFSSYMGCVTNPIWTNVTCPGAGWIHANDKWLYTRSGALGTGADSLMYDLCRVVVAFANTNFAADPPDSVGTLWAEYEVCFDGPKVSDLIPSALFTSSLDALTAPVDLPTGDAILNGGPNGPWTRVNFRAGSATAVYVPDLFPESNPGEFSGIVISQAGFYKVTTQMYFKEGAGTTSFWPNAWQADGDYQVSTVEQFTTEGPITLTEKFSERIQFCYVPADDSLVTESGQVIGSNLFKTNGGVGEPTQEDSLSQITNILIWVEAVELAELQLLGITDISPAMALTAMAKRDKFSPATHRDRTMAWRRGKKHMMHPPSKAASSVPVEEPELEDMYNPPSKKC